MAASEALVVNRPGRVGGPAPSRHQRNPGTGLGLAGAGHQARQKRPGGEQISWPTAVRTDPGLACVAAVGYSVSAWIHGKKTVYRVIRRYGGLPQVKAQDDRGTWGVLLPAALSEDRTAAFHDDGSAALAGGDPATF